MVAYRFYLREKLSKGATVDLTGGEFQHLQVLRLTVGREVELVNGEGDLAVGKITSLEKRSASVLIDEVEHAPPTTPLILGQALPRQNRLDTIIEKGTELGATEFWLFEGEGSERKTFSSERVLRLAVAAMKQCGSLYLPKIVEKPPLNEWKKSDYLTFYGDLSPGAPEFSSIGEIEKGVLLIIGPEKGFSQREEDHLARLSARGVKLHKNILRTDTAALAALAIASSLLR